MKHLKFKLAFEVICGLFFLGFGCIGLYRKEIVQGIIMAVCGVLMIRNSLKTKNIIKKCK